MDKQIIIDGVDVSKCQDFYISTVINGEYCYCVSDNAKHLACKNNPNCYFKQLKRKEQECENLKVEEKYLKQCCQKAGKELAKHSFEYDGKEKNLVVQAIELNEKYDKLKQALEEIEKVCLEDTYTFADGTQMRYDSLDDILYIINKAKGR